MRLRGCPTLAVRQELEQARMTNARKLLAASVAVVLGAVLFGLSGFSAREASAETPPAPPARFTGTVTVDGAAVTAGTLIEARIDGATCGVTTTFMSGSSARYVLDSPADQPGAAGCGAEGKVVSFYIGGKKAAETGSWLNYQLNLVDLTYVTPTPTPTSTATAVPTTPSATPKPPSTGSGTESGSSAATMLFAALGLGALAFGMGGVLAARRSR